MYATTTEANALEPESCTYLAHVLQLLKPEWARAHALQQKPPQGETCSLQPESGLHSPQLEKKPTEQQTKHSQKCNK